MQRAALCLLLMGCAFSPLATFAEEGGTGHAAPGGTATLIDLAPTKPSWVLQPIYLHYEGNASASTAIPIAGTIRVGVRFASRPPKSMRSTCRSHR